MNQGNSISHNFQPKNLISDMAFVKAMCTDEGRGLLDMFIKVMIKEPCNSINVHGERDSLVLNVFFGNINSQDRIYLGFVPHSSRPSGFLDNWTEVESYASVVEHKLHKKLAQPYCLRPGSKQWFIQIGKVLCIYSEPANPADTGVLIEAYLA